MKRWSHSHIVIVDHTKCWKTYTMCPKTNSKQYTAAINKRKMLEIQTLNVTKGF